VPEGPTAATPAGNLACKSTDTSKRRHVVEHANDVKHLHDLTGAPIHVIERLVLGMPLGVGRGLPSRCHRRLLIAECKTPQVIRGCLCPAAGREECPAVGLEHTDPRCDVARVAQIAVDRELGAQEGRA
jgi:hypothetical protein